MGPNARRPDLSEKKKPAYVDNEVSSKDLLHYFPFQLGCIFVLWFVLVSLNLLELILQKADQDQSDIDLAVLQSTERNKYISLLFAVVAFTLPIIFLYYQNFQKQSFCLMNSQEPICQNNWKDLSLELDCLELAKNTNSTLEVTISSVSAVFKSGWF